METKRRSARRAHAPVNYSEDVQRVTNPDGEAVEAPVREEENTSSSEDEEAVPPPKAGKHKAAVQPCARVRAGADEGAECGSDDDGDAPGPSVRKRQRVAAPMPTADVKNLTLFEVIWKQGNAVPYAARQWVEHYRSNRAEATAEALTLLLQAGGCDDIVKADDVEDENADDLLCTYQAKVIKEGATDPFHKASKHFQSNYMKMWDKIVSEAYNAELLQDCYMMEKISRFVIAMSVSVVRSFRFAATLTASQLVSSWVHTLLSLSDAQNTANQQLEAEQKKKPSKVVQERINMLSKAVEKKRRAVSEVQVLVNNLLDAVFAHRFRDVDMDIRALVINGIASWIFLHPPMFLADQYLKYVAWGLSDKDKVVRVAAIDGLLKLYTVDANVLPLREFTKRFTNRFLELPYDIDIQVAIRGAQLLDCLVAVKQLDRVHVKNLYRLLAEDSQQLRHAVSDLVVRLLDNSTTSDAQADTSGKDKRAGNPRAADLNKAQLQLLGLLRIMSQLAEAPTPAAPRAGPSTSAAATEAQAEPLDPATVAGVVDALYDKLPVLQDWNVLCAALLDDRLAAVRGSVGDANLAQLLRASVRLKADRAGAKKTKTRGVRAAKEAEANSSSAQTMSLVLKQQIPRLLHKFPTEGRVVASLMDTVTDMQLDVYSLKQQEKDLEALARLVSDLLLKHSDKVALKAAANTLIHLAEKSPTALQDSTQLVLSEAMDTAASKLAAAYQAAKAVPDEELEDAVEEASQGGQGNSQLFNLHLALLRVNVLQGQGCNSLGTHPDVSTTLTSILQEAGKGRNYGAGVIGAAATGVFMSLLWGLRAIMAVSGSVEGADNAARVEELISKRNTALEYIADAFGAIEDQAVRDAVFTVAVDLVLVLGSRQKWHNTPLSDADLDVSSTLMRACWAHCLDVLDRNASPPEDQEAGDEDDALNSATEGQVGSGSSSAAVQAKVAAVAGLGRLLAFNALQDAHFKWLGTQFVALMGGHGKAVTEVVKDVCRHMRKSKPGLLPDIYLAAMKISFSAALLTAAESQEAQEGALQDFSRLCAAIASTYAGHNISRGPLLHICHGGVEFSLESVPQHLPFLEWGLQHFTPKLQAEAAQELLEELEEGVSDVQRDAAEPAWSSYDLYTKGLQERAVRRKLATKGALKQPLNLQPSAHKVGRRISFAREDPEPQAVQQEATPKANKPSHQANLDGIQDLDPVEAGCPRMSLLDSTAPDEAAPMDAVHKKPEDNEERQGEEEEQEGEEEEQDGEKEHGTPKVSPAPTPPSARKGKAKAAAQQGKGAEKPVHTKPQETVAASGRPSRHACLPARGKASEPALKTGKRAGKAAQAEPATTQLEEAQEEQTQGQAAGQGKGRTRAHNSAKASIAIMPPLEHSEDERPASAQQGDVVQRARKRRSAAAASQDTGGSTDVTAPSHTTQLSSDAEPAKGRANRGKKPPIPPLQAGLAGTGKGRAEVAEPAAAAGRRFTRGSQNIGGSQVSQEEGVGAGGQKRRRGGRNAGVGSQDNVGAASQGSLDSLDGMMPTEEQLPFASQQPSSGDGSAPPFLSMSDPEALPGLPASAHKQQGNKGKDNKKDAAKSQEEDVDEGHARKRRRRR